MVFNLGFKKKWISQLYDFSQTWERGFYRIQTLLTRQRFSAVPYRNVLIQDVFLVGHSEKAEHEAELYSAIDQDS